MFTFLLERERLYAFVCGTHLRNHQTLSARISLDIHSSYSWQSGWFCQQPRPRETRILIAAPDPARGWGIWVCAAGPGAPSSYCNPFAFRRAARPWMAHSYRSDPRKKHEEHFINLWRVYEHCVNALCPKRARENKWVLYVHRRRPSWHDQHVSLKDCWEAVL